MYFNFIQLSGICIYIWFKCYLSVFTVQSEWHICGSISSKLELVQRRLHRNHLSWSNDILSMWKYCTYNLYEWLMFLFSTRYLHSVNESLLGRVFFQVVWLIKNPQIHTLPVISLSVFAATGSFLMPYFINAAIMFFDFESLEARAAKSELRESTSLNNEDVIQFFSYVMTSFVVALKLFHICLLYQWCSFR